MGTQYASGRHAIALCDRCGRKVMLLELTEQIVKQKPTGMLVCGDCLDTDHPQLMLGSFPIFDPQALKNARTDTGVTVSRSIQWGWNPVGGGNSTINPLTTNSLVATGAVGSVTVVTA